MTKGASQIVAELEALGFHLWEEAGRLRFRGPTGVLTPERRSQLRDHKQAVLVHLREAQAPVLTPHPDQRHEPFPVTDVQAAYLLGRTGTFALGEVGCHGYGELAFDERDPHRLEAAFRALIDRHDMLRAVVSPDGTQRVLPEVPPYQVRVNDLRSAPRERAEQAVRQTRAEMDHRVYDPGQWPLFDLRLTRTPGGDLMHLSIDFLICDFVSIQVLLGELNQLYQGRELASLSATYRDYLLADRRSRPASQTEEDHAYWWSRIDDLPPAPDLPARDGEDTGAPPRFRRWQATLEPVQWDALRARAAEHGVTPAGAVLAAYAEVVGGWSRHPRFTLDVTLLDRRPLGADVGRLVGDFTSVSLLEVDALSAATFADRAVRLRDQLWRDLDHRLCTGVEVMREIGRRRGAASVLMPVVFTSAIGAGEPAVANGAGGYGELRYGISQTPQVWIDCQNIERHGGLATNWDVREGVFPDGVIDEMFGAFTALLRALSAGDDAWRTDDPVPLPAATAARREQVNNTAAATPDTLLHEPVLAQAGRTPEWVAVVAGQRAWTYRELVSRVTATAGELHKRGCRPGDIVAIVMDKGVEQVIGVLGTLLAGGVYLPVDTSQPPARRAAIISDAGARHRLTQSWVDDQDGGAIAVDLVSPAGDPPDPVHRTPEDLAYVVYTSGSTGRPKGVMISHAGAANTVADVNRRFAVTGRDCVLGVASLGFDLSVYDIFGPLSVGGCLVLPDTDRRADPSHWAELAATHEVTLWNSVPAQFQMLVDYLSTGAGPAGPPLLPSLRLALLSGDWIPVDLPGRARRLLPSLRLVSLGGATEASIWSIAYPIGDVPDEWRSIPYGAPLANQSFHVLDGAGRPRPDWVAGELYIGGAGLALGYLGDEERTAQRFVRHRATGERLYRTGDFGRYRPDGIIEFLGREDLQVKIRGHRIELAEVEAAMAGHPAVGKAVALVTGDVPLARRLVAVAEPARCAPTAVAGHALTTVAHDAGEAAVAGTDWDSYLRYTRDLDHAALLAMVSALRAAGLFGSPAQSHRLDEVLAAADVAPRHHRLVRRWLRALAQEGVLAGTPDGGYRLAQPVNDLAMAHVWRRLDGGLMPPAEAPLVEYFRASAAHLPALLRGETDSLRLLFPEGRLEVSANLYEEALFNRWANHAAGAVVRALVEKAAPGRTGGPPRILEVGAGGGGTTAAVLEALRGQPLDYLYTDLSPFFLKAGRERFAERPGMRFATFDLDLDHRTQGTVAEGGYDVVIAGDVLHATRHVDDAVARLRELLAPGGWLVFLEMTRDHYQIMTSLELLVRLDDRTADRRAGRDVTFLDREEWSRVVNDAGGELAVCLPDSADRALAELGMQISAARFKADQRRLDAAELRDYLAASLPDYLVPAHLQVVDVLPLTSNGKVDRARVAQLLPAGPSGAQERDSGEPADELERQIAAIWADVLQLPHLGRDDDFYERGGDSLLAAQLVGRVTEEIPLAASMFFDQVLRLMLEARTVAEFSAALRAEPALADGGGPPVDPAVTLTPLGGEGRDIWVLVPDTSDLLTASAPVRDALAVRGTVLGLAAAGSATPATQLAVRYAEALSREAGDRPLQLLGTGSGSMLALETARALAEADRPVAGLTVVGRPAPADDGHPPAPYAGDITVFCAQAEVPAEEAYWKDVCLGEVCVRSLPGAGGLDSGLLGDAAALALARALGDPG